MQNILNKFDMEVNDRTNELEQLKIAYEKEKEAFEQWKRDIFEPQERQYVLILIVTSITNYVIFLKYLKHLKNM